MEILGLIQTRRSVRRYKAASVKEEDLTLVLEAARWAPSWANTQCWRFVVVRDTTIKEKLAEALTPRNPATAAIRSAPIVIVACAERSKSGFYQGMPTTDKGDWYMFDVALAMQNLILAAHSRGLGTVHVGNINAEKVAKILEVPEDVAVVEMTPLGYPDEEPVPPRRKELVELIFNEKYGQR